MEIISNNTMESKGVIEKNEMFFWDNVEYSSVSYTHLRAHET